MANQDVRVSALQSASTLSTEDLALATVVDELSETGYTSKKITEGAKASQYMEAFTFANLNTSAKTIVGAINEAATTGGSDEFIIHMTDTTVTETAADIIDAFDNGSEIWLESQITGEALKARLPLLAYISDSSQLVLRFSGITYANNRYRYCDVQMLRNPEQIVGKQAINVTFAVIDDATTSASSVWSSQKTASELAGKAEIDDTATDTETTWSSSQIVSLLPTESASGAVASFETPLTLPLVSHNVTIEPVQEGTGDPSPSNVRPISGWSEMNVTRTGANIWDEQWELGLINTNNGTNGDDTTRIRSKNYIPIKADATYYIGSDGGATYLFFYDKDKNYLGYHGTNKNNSSFTPELLTNTKDPQISFENAYFVRFRHDVTTDNNVFINYPATETDYHAYTGQTYTRTFLDSNDDPVTVYGGSDNLKTGEGESTCAFVEFDGSQDEPWVISSSGTFFYLDGIAYKHDETQSAVMCSIFQPLPNGNSASFTGDNQCLFLLSTANDRIYVKHTESTSISDFRTFLSNNPMRLVYILATPQTFHTDPLNLDTLEGVNNIWADTGDTAVEYKQDIQTYIDKKIAEAVGGNRSLSLMKSAPEETKEETKQEVDEDVNR